MDEGPFRMPRQADRDDHNQPEEPIRKEESKHHHREEPKTVQRATPSHRLPQDDSPVKRFVWPIIGVVVVLVIAVIIWFVMSNSKSSDTGIDSNKYQAVFFTNGQVYFGKLHSFNDEYMKLTDIYYLQTQNANDSDSKNPQKTSDTSQNPTLIKLGSELHGPEDEMIVSKDQILFYENLKKDGKVAESIEKFKNPN